MAREIRKETHFGIEREVIYENDRKVGEIHRESRFGGSVKREYDNSGRFVSESQRGQSLSGEPVERKYDRSGRFISETRRVEGVAGTVYRECDPDGNPISEMRRHRTLMGGVIKRINAIRGRKEESPSGWVSSGSATGGAYASPSPDSWNIGTLLLVLAWVVASVGGASFANRLLEGHPTFATVILAVLIWLICLPGALLALAVLLPIALVLFVLIAIFR